MKIKSGILMIMAMIVGCAGTSLPVQATEAIRATHRDVIDRTANKVLDDLFLLKMISPSGNMVSYDFNSKGRLNVGMWELYLATYDYENVPMSVADAGIDELGAEIYDGVDEWGNKVRKKPSWAKAVFEDDPHSVDGNRTLSASVSYTPGMKLDYDPGVLYYALGIYDGSKGDDVAELYWVRGKIDYRECAYSSLYGEPYLRYTCNGRASGGRYTYDRWREEGDVYKTWADEWNETLKGDLEDVEGEIDDWMGDEAEKLTIEAELDRIERVAEDASKTTEITDTVEMLRGKLITRDQTLAEEREEAEKKRLEEEEKKRLEEEEKKRLEEEEKKRLEEEEKKRAEEANKRPVVAWTPSASTEVKEENEVEKPEVSSKENSDENNDYPVVAVNASAGNDSENDELKEVKPEGADNEVKAITDFTEVPALRGSEAEVIEEGGFWEKFWWVLILILGVIAGVIWWMKRAFFAER